MPSAVYRALSGAALWHPAKVPTQNGHQPALGTRPSQTLASDAAWEKTQRSSGRLFFLLSLTIALTAIFFNLWVNIIVTAGGTLAFCATSHIYAWRLARAERESLAGETPGA